MAHWNHTCDNRIKGLCLDSILDGIADFIATTSLWAYMSSTSHYTTLVLPFIAWGVSMGIDDGLDELAKILKPNWKMHNKVNIVQILNLITTIASPDLSPLR